MKKRSKQGFTLIELLVVIAVIALLAAILFPVFAQAREKARQSTCLSNLKQIGQAMLIYAEDFDGRYPGGPDGRAYLWVPGPKGSWDRMPTACCGDVAQGNVPFRLLPYLKNERVFLCPSDSNGDRQSGGGTQWNPAIARYTYQGNLGLSQGWSWPSYPSGNLSVSGKPISLATVSRPALLTIAGDGWVANHSRNVPGEARWNACYADGHAKFTRILDASGLPPEQTPYAWNWFNPSMPVDIEKPCKPTCAAEAAQS